MAYIQPNDDSAATYAANNGLNSAYLSTNGLLPVNTDLDSFPDFQDTDSDDDATFDAEENGLAANSAGTFTDADGDGIDDDFDNVDNTTEWDVNGRISNGNLWQMQVYLGDSDGDTFLDSALTNDLNFRDNTANHRSTVDFDGVDDCVVAESIVDFSNGSTLMGWFLLDPSVSGTVTIAGQRNHSVRINANNNVMYSEIVAENNSGNDVDFSTGTATGNVDKLVTKGVWQHFASVADFNTGSLTIYLNGLPIDTMNISGVGLSNPIAGEDYFIIGRNSDLEQEFAGAQFFDGYIYEVKAYNAALNQQQIQEQVFQEIEQDLSSPDVVGAIIPFNIEGAQWSDLEFYYGMDAIVESKVTDRAANNRGQLLNVTTDQPRTAPLPLVGKSGGMWDSASTWLDGDGVVDALTFNSLDHVIVQLQGSALRAPMTKYTLNRNGRAFGLLVNSNAELEVTGDSGITIGRYLNLDGLLDLEGESQLLQGANSILDETSEGTLERDQQGTFDQYTYNYWGSPVGTANNSSNNNAFNPKTIGMDGTDAANPQDIVWINDGDVPGSTPITLSNRWLYKFVNNGWVYLGNGGNVNVGEGFIHKGPNVGISQEQNYVFVGKPNNGTINASVNMGEDILLGNPYPSAIDANEFIDDNLAINGPANVMTGTIYFWEHWGGGTHTQSLYQGGYATLTKSGGTRAAVHPEVSNAGGDSGFLTPTRYIAVGQGFFVRGFDGGTLTFENDQRTFRTEGSGDSQFFRGKEEPKETERTSQANANSNPRLWINFTTVDGLQRQLLVAFDPNTTEGYDIGYDGELFDNNPSDGYWLLDDGRKLVISTLPELTDATTVAIGITSATAGSGTFEIDMMENIDPSVDIAIYDKVNDVTYDLRAGNAIVSLDAGEAHDRFEVVFGNTSTLNNEEFEVENDFNIVASDDGQTVIIINQQNLNVNSVRIHNILGQEMLRMTESFTDELKSIPFTAQRGIYLVSVETENGQFTKKIMKR